MPSYDMTYNGGVGFGGGGVSSWIGGIGSAWANNLANGMKLFTDFYNFQDQNLVRPSYVNAMIGNNVANQELAQLARTNAFIQNQKLSNQLNMSSGVSPNMLYNGQVVPDGQTNIPANAQTNLNTQVQHPQYTPDRVKTAPGVAASYLQHTGRPMTSDQLLRYLKGEE